MAFLPDNRLEPALPFSYSAIDFFGPFIIKERRSDVKCYGVLFTCKGSRSVQLETANCLDRSSFINALSRFIIREALWAVEVRPGSKFHGGTKQIKESDVRDGSRSRS